MDSGAIDGTGARAPGAAPAAPFDGGRYRKLQRTVQVRFATAATTVQTREGPVQAQAGDAIVTGVKGEQWPVHAEAFAIKYQGPKDHPAGTGGAFTTRAQAVRAQRMDRPFEVVLGGGRGTLKGAAGDWLVEYEAGDRAVIGAAIFADTYGAAINDAPLVIGLMEPASAEMEHAALQLAATLTHTSCVILRAAGGGIDGAFALPGEGRLHALPRTYEARSQLSDIDVDLGLQQTVTLAHHCFLVIGEADAAATAAMQGGASLPYWAPADQLAPQAGKPEAMFGLPSPAPFLSVPAVLALARRLRQRRAAADARGAYLKHMLLALVPAWLHRKPRVHHDMHRAQAEMLLAQLSELDAFNGEQLQPASGAASHAAVPAAGADSPLTALYHRADMLASQYQARWQRLLFASTGDIANGLAWTHSPLAALRELCRRAFSLSACGWIAAMLFAAFTEVAGGCEADDRWGNRLCASAGWHHWAGTVLIVLYLGVLLVALWRYVDAKNGQCERKHQDYRLLAECLRVQDVWARSGIDRTVANSLPPKAMADATWVVPAVRALARLFASEARGGGASAEAVQRQFVTGQLRYYETTMIKRREQACTVLSRRASSGLALFVFLVLVLVTNTLSESLFHHGFDGMAHHYLVLATLGGLAWWAASKKVLDSFALEGEIKRGQHTLAALKNADITIAALAGADAAALRDGVIVGLGTQFVVDQANWHALHRERPIEAVTGG